MDKTLNEAMAEQFQGNFLDATDLIHKGNVVVTIADLVPPNRERDGAKKLIDKAILSFVGKQKRLVLNKGNAKTIKLQHGEPDQWIGKKITLTVRLVDAFGEKNLPVIRVVPPPDAMTTWSMRKKFGAEVPPLKKEPDDKPQRNTTRQDRTVPDTEFGEPTREPGDD